MQRLAALLRNPLSTHLTQQNVSLQTFSMSTWQDLARTGLGVVLCTCWASSFRESNTNCRHRIKHGNVGKECSMFFIAAGFQSIDTCMKRSTSFIVGLILAQGSPGINFADLYKMGTDPSEK